LFRSCAILLSPFPTQGTVQEQVKAGGARGLMEKENPVGLRLTFYPETKDTILIESWRAHWPDFVTRDLLRRTDKLPLDHLTSS
jgi:hypothetical protein